MSLADAIRPLDWMNDAACTEVDPDLFFVESERDRLSLAQAKAVCAACPVQPDCALYAIQAGDLYGIWGGMTLQERRRFARRSRRRSLAVVREPEIW